jgi:GTP-binding protein EngB required for normal cell division
MYIKKCGKVFSTSSDLKKTENTLECNYVSESNVGRSSFIKLQSKHKNLTLHRKPIDVSILKVPVLIPFTFKEIK